MYTSIYMYILYMKTLPTQPALALYPGSFVCDLQIYCMLLLKYEPQMSQDFKVTLCKAIICYNYLL